MGSSAYHPQGWRDWLVRFDWGDLVASCRWALPFTTPRPAIRGRPFEPRKAVLCAGLRPTGSHPCQPVLASQSSALRRASPDRLGPMPARPRLAKQCFASGFARPASMGCVSVLNWVSWWRPADGLFSLPPPGLPSVAARPRLAKQCFASGFARPARTHGRPFEPRKAVLCVGLRPTGSHPGQSPMKITEIREKTVSIASPMRNAVIDFSTMTISAVVVATDRILAGRPLVGYGFTSNGRYGQSGILRERMIPRLTRADPADLRAEEGDNIDPFKCWQVMMRNEKPGGHGERSVAVGAIDMALWDLVAKAEQKPLCVLLAERFRDGDCDSSVRVYAAGGYYYPDGALAQLKSELRGYLDMGFREVKMKIGGASLDEDLARIEAALEVVGDGRRLAVDANARFDVETAIRYAQAIDPLGLRWFEEPVAVLDFEALREVNAATETPIATGENLFSCEDSLNLIRYAALDSTSDYLQMDPALSYGLVEYLKTLEMLDNHGWSAQRCVPHGGHQFGLHLAAGLGLMGNEAYPGVFEPFGRFAPQMRLEEGLVTLSQDPGIGYETVPEIYEVLAGI